MLTSPQPLDWKLQSYIDTSILWHPRVYSNFGGPPEFTSQPHPQPLNWNILPFEEVQLDKIPRREGIYLIIHRYECLDSLQLNLTLYVGEATNLRERLRKHMDTARQSTNDLKSPTLHRDRLKLLFRLFHSLSIQYCTLKSTQEEREDLEKQLIGLLDPPFNKKHRTVPRGQAILMRPGTIFANPGKPRPAFS